MKDWRKLLKSGPASDYREQNSVWKKLPNSLSSEACVQECHVAIYNWSIHMLHESEGLLLSGWPTPADAIAAWKEALDYWELQRKKETHE